MSRRVIWVVVTAVVVVGGAIVFAAARTTSCAYPRPQSELPVALRTLGDFDQGADATDTATLQHLAVESATAMNPQLVGVAADTPVREAGAASTIPDAVVVPLRNGPGTTPPVVELAAFRVDCGGTAYFYGLRPFRGAAFPSVTQDAASGGLGASAPRLVNGGDPFAPLWRDPASGRSVSAVGG